MTKHKDALERMRRLHPKVWRAEHWIWEAVNTGVVLAVLIAVVYTAYKIIVT